MFIYRWYGHAQTKTDRISRLGVVVNLARCVHGQLGNIAGVHVGKSLPVQQDVSTLAEAVAGTCTTGAQVTYTTLLDGYVKAGDLSGARLLWLDMRQSGVLPNAATFNTLLTGLAASPDPESLKVQSSRFLCVSVGPGL